MQSFALYEPKLNRPSLTGIRTTEFKVDTGH
jgi:hypothetical protein